MILQIVAVKNKTKINIYNLQDNKNVETKNEIYYP